MSDNANASVRAKKRRRKRKAAAVASADAAAAGMPPADAAARGVAAKRARAASEPSPLFAQMQARLEGGQFRWLNELLYTSQSGSAAAEFRNDPVRAHTPTRTVAQWAASAESV